MSTSEHGNDAELLEENLEQYTELSYLQRIGRMCKGLGQPHNSKEYKAAVIEVQRLAAPLTAILLPTIAIIVLLVMSSIETESTQEIKVEVVQPDETEKLEEVEPPPPPEEPIDEPVEVDVTLDMPSGPASDNLAPPSNEPVSHKPAEMDTMMMIKSPKTANVFGGRDPGTRGRLIAGGGGNAQTEAAVMKALRWLKYTQESNGSWPDAYRNSGGNRAEPAVAGLAILSFLAHGETTESSEFGDTVRKALQFLMNSVQEDAKRGIKFAASDKEEYSFLIATYALCEAYAMTNNPEIKPIVERALKRIVAGQSATGGWNYKLDKLPPRNEHPDDVSYGGWAMQALKAGKMTKKLDVPGLDESIKKATVCLKTRNADKEWGFIYRPGSRQFHGLASVGCLCMQLLGLPTDATVKTALNVMKTWTPTFAQNSEGGPKTSNPQYSCYYATQCKFHAAFGIGADSTSKKLWSEWNKQMQTSYIPSIHVLPEKIRDAKGKEQQMGYWESKDHYGSKWIDTCFVALQLMVYYRHLPTTSASATHVEQEIEQAVDTGGDITVEVAL